LKVLSQDDIQKLIHKVDLQRLFSTSNRGDGVWFFAL